MTDFFLGYIFLLAVLLAFAVRRQTILLKMLCLMGWVSALVLWFLKGRPLEGRDIAHWEYFQRLLLLSVQCVGALLGYAALKLDASSHRTARSFLAVGGALILAAYVLCEERVVHIGFAFLAFGWLMWSLRCAPSSPPSAASSPEVSPTVVLQFLGSICLFMGFVAFSILLRGETVQQILTQRLECLLPELSPWHMFAGGLLLAGSLMMFGRLLSHSSPLVDGTGSFWVQAIISVVGCVIAQAILLRWGPYWSLFACYKIFFSATGLAGIVVTYRRVERIWNLYRYVETLLAMMTYFCLILLPWGLDSLAKVWILAALWIRCWGFLMVGLVTHLLSSEHDLRAMGGLRTRTPVLFAFWWVGLLLIGLFWAWAGYRFVSLSSAEGITWVTWSIVMVGYAMLVIIQMQQFARLTTLIFLGDARANERVLAYVHDISWSLCVALSVILLALAGCCRFLFAGFPGASVWSVRYSCGLLALVIAWILGGVAAVFKLREGGLREDCSRALESKAAGFLAWWRQVGGRLNSEEEVNAHALFIRKIRGKVKRFSTAGMGAFQSLLSNREEVGQNCLLLLILVCLLVASWGWGPYAFP